MIRRFRLEVAYDGTAYAGWQVQPRHTTVQGELERVLREITGAEKVRVESSGRTDAGVHARGQVAHTDLLDPPMRPEKLALGMNALLAEDIRVQRIRSVPDSFHARFSAIGKEYRYYIHNAPVWSPTDRLYRSWIREPLNLAAMQKAAALLQGQHDFAAFAANPNREIDGTVRHVSILKVAKAGPLITVRAVGDGFLYKMVRSLAGFLIRVGREEVPPQAAADILHSKVRTARVPTAPPEGLFLWKVYYDKVPAS
jgi:tRNA pseudouridine38-40 synthase